MATEQAGEILDSKHFELTVLNVTGVSFKPGHLRKEPSVEVHATHLPEDIKHLKPGKKGVLFTGLLKTHRVHFTVVVPGLPLISRKKNRAVLGDAECSVEDLLVEQDQASIHLEVDPCGRIDLKVDEETASLSLQEVIPVSSKEDLFDFESVDGVKTMLKDIVGVLNSLTKVAKFAAAAHPIARLVVDVFSAVLLAPVTEELQVEDEIQKLVAQMRRLYFFVKTLEQEKSLREELKEVVKSILKQTVKCAYFIKEYVHKRFAERAAKSILSREDHEKIINFLDAFAILGESLDRGILTEMETTLAVVNEGVKNIQELNILDRSLAPIAYDTGESRPRCLEGTCQGVIDSIIKWVSQDEPSSRVLWLHGPAGTGKSTIATTLFDTFNEVGRLGAFIYFDRKGSDQTKSHPEGVIRTLAHQLSCFDWRIRQKVVDTIKATPNISQMPSNVQFTKLIIQPLEKVQESLEKEGPIVIIIDALDECIGGDNDEAREAFFNIWKNSSASLPPTVRLIITTRSSPILEQPHISLMELEKNHEDVKHYILSRLDELLKGTPKARKDIAQEQLGEKLASLADGLFIWAATALRFVWTKKWRVQSLRKLVNGSDEIRGDIDSLYATALHEAGIWEESDPERVKAVLGAIILVKTPLSPQAIDSLLGLEEEEEVAAIVVDSLASVLHHDLRKAGKPVTALHSTFSEYLTSCKGEPWFIEKKYHQSALAKHCLSTMHRWFTEKNILEAIKAEDMAYSCKFWVTHILELEIEQDEMADLTEDLLKFLREHLLHWLEGMSILHESHNCAGSLEQLHTWVNHLSLAPSISANLLGQLVYDGARFAAFFSRTIADYPHSISLNALPFAPTESLIYEFFHNDVSQSPTVLGGYQQQWSRSLAVFRELSREILSLTISPDGKKLLATGESQINEISPQLRLWDMSTNLEIIPAVTFDDYGAAEMSLDGAKIWYASGKGTLYEIDAATGEIKDEVPYSEWSGGIQNAPSQDNEITNELPGQRFCRFAFSRHTDRALLGAVDGSLYIIDLATKKQIKAVMGRPLPPDPTPNAEYPDKFLRSITFDEMGSHFAVASHNGEIEVWDTTTAEISSHLKGHSYPVTVLRFTKEKLISGSTDGKICVWNINKSTGQPVSTVQIAGAKFTEYLPMAINPSGDYLISTKANTGTMYFWSIYSGAQLGTLQASFNPASAITFSKDRTRVISGAFLGDIHVWDVSSFASEEAQLIHRHERPVHHVKLSADGFCVRSWREYEENFYEQDGQDHDVKFWDVVTGKMLEMQTYDRRATFAASGSDVIIPIVNNEEEKQEHKTEGKEKEEQENEEEEEEDLEEKEEEEKQREENLGDFFALQFKSSYRRRIYHSEKQEEERIEKEEEEKEEEEQQEEKEEKPEEKEEEEEKPKEEQKEEVQEGQVQGQVQGEWEWEREQEEKEKEEKREEDIQRMDEESTSRTSIGEVVNDSKSENQDGEWPKENKIPLLIREGVDVREWKIPTEGYWAETIQLFNASNQVNWDKGTREPGQNSVRLMKEIDGSFVPFWNLPSELGGCRSIDAKGNVLTCGMWDGRVFSVFFPDKILGRDASIKITYHATVT
ncbi:hypothetical protein GYMLUDRAFT_79629 [Collybiopsis luxurians FD-317 M1]|nr:hypothetical protein GYMLUDRAFT_79629 [Collybiopsis luxurians FD-317 M1]